MKIEKNKYFSGKCPYVLCCEKHGGRKLPVYLIPRRLARKKHRKRGSIPTGIFLFQSASLCNLTKQLMCFFISRGVRYMSFLMYVTGAEWVPSGGDVHILQAVRPMTRQSLQGVRLQKPNGDCSRRKVRQCRGLRRRNIDFY